MISSAIKKSLFYVGVALLLLSSIAAAPAPAEPGAVGRLPRGKKKISVRQEYLVLGELLEMLTLQSGVPLALHKNDGWASGIPMTASLHDQELPVVLSALEELFTHRFNSAEWRPGGENEKGYLLRFGRSAELAADVVLQEKLELVKREARELHRLSLLPAEARAAQAANNPNLSVPALATSRSIDLLSGLSAAELETALSGTPVQIPWERLTPAGRAYSSLPTGGGRDPNEIPRPGPRTFQAKLSQSLRPGFYVSNVDGRAASLAGGPLHDEPWLRRNAGGWMTPGDPEARGVMEGLKRPDDESKPLPARTVPRWLIAMTDRYDRDFIAEYDRPLGRATTGGAVEMRDWKRTLGVTVFRLRLMAKDDGPILLLRTAQSLESRRRDTVPWPLTRQLRASVATDNGFLSLDALTSLSELSPEQVATCSVEFGGVEKPDWPKLLPMLLFRDRLLPAWKRQLSRPEGLPLRDSGLVARVHLLSGEDPEGARGLELMRPQWGRLAARLWIEDRPARPQRPGRPVDKPERIVKWALYNVADRSSAVHQWSTPLYQRTDLSTVHKPPLQPRPAKAATAHE